MNATDYTLDLCARIAGLSDVAGNITRLFLSPATRAVHTLLQAEMEALGLEVRVDYIGNLRGLHAADRSDAPVLLMGSHIDTVPNAGAYDGILGVALPLALLRSLEGRRFPFAIELIAFSEEEGIRFKLPFIGSRGLLGQLAPADFARTDSQGTTLAQAIRNFGLDPDDRATLTANTFGFLEVHIEQGPVLDSLNLPLGVVTAIAGQTRLQLTFHGQANHAGTTPAAFRKDALMAAAEWLLFAERLPHLRRDDALRVTVGTIQALPGAANIIPGEAVLSLDVRHPKDSTRNAAVNKLLRKAARIAQLRGCSVSSFETCSQPATPLSTVLIEALAAAASNAHRMPSGAGHDAMILAPHVPSAMLFVRSPVGISHHPAESVLPDDVTAALAACLRFLEALQP